MRLELETGRFYLGRDYSEAVEAAGGVPVHLSLIPKRDYIRESLRFLDGILLPGSDTDVDPAYFGEEPHHRLKKVVPEKDETDLMVIEEAEQQGHAVLAICFGMQVLNVARGGTLYQDIESHIEGSIKHEQGMPLARNSHAIDIQAGSLIADFESVRGNGLSVKVNSHHHQAIREIGRDLKAVAWAKDSVVEGIQDTRDDRFVLGVQWHPELSWRSDPFSRDIFEHFVGKAGSSSKS